MYSQKSTKAVAYGLALRAIYDGIVKYKDAGETGQEIIDYLYLDLTEAFEILTPEEQRKEGPLPCRPLIGENNFTADTSQLVPN